jgi:transposase
MGQFLHGSAKTTYAVRGELQRSEASVAQLAKRFGINEKTVIKWRKRQSVEDMPMGPKERRSTVLTPVEEAAIVALRVQARLPLDDVYVALKDVIPHLTRSSLHRCLQPYHPWTNGQAERMVRTIKEATVKSFHYSSVQELRRHVRDWLTAYNFAKQLKALRFKTPYEAIEELWKSKPEIFNVEPHHHIPGLNS